MEPMKTLAFTGLRPHKLPFGHNEQHPVCVALKTAIAEQLRHLIETENVRHFISGMAMGVDQICAEVVLQLKNEYRSITLEAAIPCKDQDRLWSEHCRARYRNILSYCDSQHILSASYTEDCMRLRNKYMVDKCDFLLAVWNGRPGGTANTIRYARQQNKWIIVINPATPGM